MWAFIRRLFAGRQPPTGADPINKLPDDARDVLANTDHFELLSLDPCSGPTREDGHFYGWRVLGSADVGAETAREVLAALERGIAESDGTVVMCFNPRHGVRARREADAVDLVICFFCAQVYVHYADGRRGGVLVTGSPEPVFDRVLQEAGVPLASERVEPGHATDGGDF